MAAGLSEIAGYFEEGKRQKATHMIVVCDTFDHEDYPVYATGDKDCLEKYDAHNGPNMQRVMEVYDLRKSWSSQATGRVMNLPKR